MGKLIGARGGPEAEEASGLAKAADEVGSNFWKNLLELSFKDSEDLVKFIR